MILLVLVAAVLLVALNLNHKKLGKEVALLGTLAVVLVAVYLGNNMMVLPEEDDVFCTFKSGIRFGLGIQKNAIARIKFYP